MVARHLLLYLVLIIIPDLYLFKRYIRPKRTAAWKKLLWFVPGLVMLILTISMACSKHFAPSDYTMFSIYLALFGLLVCTKWAFLICSVIGRGVARLFHSRMNWGNLAGTVLALFVAYATIYGLTAGVNRFEVNHITLQVQGLPPAFQGYRIVLFSDAHVGSFNGYRQALMHEAYDSINAQQADVICFVGDLQNVKPDELDPFRHLLNSLQSRDGVLSVLGNHDYAEYFNGTEAEKDSVANEMVEQQRMMGWRLLNNEHVMIRRGTDSIYVAGMENDGEPPFPHKADLEKAIDGIPQGAFTIMLQHDPTSWQRTILPGCEAQLTLSGHTHGGQIGLFGVTASSMRYAEDDGLYDEGGRLLYVTRGLGGLLPFRFGVTAEIVVITLEGK